MQFTTSMIALLGLAASSNALSDMQLCAAKNQGGMNAIGRFCQKTDMVAPSKYASDGMWSPDLRTHVAISGNCNPPQWIPEKYCYSQLFNMCAHGGKHGGSSHHYGNNNCQHWKIKYHQYLGL
ncbi:hypothetical protein LTR53_016418 [Teratosphaeriaceae sp. CCFEE 6253]|nr:hypothetical protein LTR53_016418 [Teratosphaeriaceae sp. CCFEE 6253]